MQTHKSAPGALRVFALLIVSLSESLFPANPSLRCPGSAASVSADGTTQLIPLSQNWSDPGLISANDNWGGVPGIIGFRGDGLTTVAATDPQTIVADGSATPIDVIANQANPNTQTSGGVAEFDGIANPVVALQGSGTASAPHIVMSVNTTGLSAIKVAYNLRDVDGSADNAVQPVALQFRVGASGSYTNIPAGFVADASTGPSLATQVTPVSASLPGAADDQPLVQIRIITTDASGSDEWIGIDDILIFVPSVAKFDSFTAAHREGGKVLLKWRTGFEVDNLGFNVLREQSGSRVRINSEMIAGSALMVGEGTMLRSGYSYSWADELPNGIDARYWLEAIDLNGRSSIFGPVSAIASEVRSGLPPEGGQSLSLSSVGRKAARTSLSRPVPRSAAPPQAATLQTSALPAAAMRPALKLSVDQEGWYRVTHQELTSAGFDPALDPRLLQLFAEGVEQAITVEGEADGRMSPTDGVEFYGMGLDTPWTNTRLYWLVVGEKPGLRIKSAKAKGSKTAGSGFAYTVERRDQTVYFSSLRNGDRENFFGAVIARSPVNQSLTTHHIDRESTEDSVLEVTLQGVTTADHRVAVGLNGSDLGDIVFAAMRQGSARFNVPRGAIREGHNIVTLASKEGESDVSIVDSLRLTYRHAYRADSDELRFTASGKRVLTIDGFTSSGIRVVDVTDPAAPVEVKTTIEQRQSGYAVTVKTPKGGKRTLMAFSADRIKRPVSVIADQPSNLKDESRAADLIVVTRGEFIPAIEPLVRLRESQGLSVAIVDVEDIYDEFNHGEKSPAAMKDFFAHAHARWSKPPKYALLIGDASLDPKDHLGLGDFDVVPTRLVDTNLMETASDEWLVDFDGDDLGELALGRLPVRTVNEASLLIRKIVAYEDATEEEVLLVSDDNDGIDFRGGTRRLRALVPDAVRVEAVDRGLLADGATKSQVLDSIRRGKRIVSYFGHGSVDTWRGGILTTSDANEIASGNSHSLFLLITCLNGYFQDPGLESLAESLLKTEQGGAAAVWASSGMCGADEQLVMSLEMFRLMFNSASSGEPLTLGEAVLKAKRVTVESDVRKTYVLLGDPSSRLR